MSVCRILFLAVVCLGLLLCVTVLWSETVRFDGQPDRNLYKVVSSPDGKLQAKTNKDDNTIRLWDVTTSKEWAILKGHEVSPYSLAFSPDGKMLVSGGNNTIRLWNVTTGKEKASFKHSAVICLAFSPDGAVLASGSLGDTLFLWDVASGKRRYLEEPPWLGDTSVDYPTYVAFSPDGKTLAAIVDERIGLWDVESGKHTATLSSGFRFVTLTTDGKLVALLEKDEGTGMKLREWSPFRGKCIVALGVALLCLSFPLIFRSYSRLPAITDLHTRAARTHKKVVEV